jgi:hypothetical membrane protein
MKIMPISIAVAYFVVIILVAHLFAQPGYIWTDNTISDLAAQGHANKWIMQAGFIGFGAMLAIGVLYYLTKNPRLYFLYPVAVYGLSILLAGIFCTAPIDPSIPYSTRDADLHSLFATIAGIGMTLGIMWQIVVSANNQERVIRILFLLLVVGFSALFGMAENGGMMIGKGIFQRLLYLSGLAWLVYEELAPSLSSLLR